jgi:hypothetical protein
MAIPSALANLLTLKGLTTIISLIGALFGFYVFFDSYVFWFKPKVYLGTKVIFTTEPSKKPYILAFNSIICSLEVRNHRKRFGII